MKGSEDMNRKIIILFMILSFFLIPVSFAICKSQAIGDSSLAAAQWNVTLEQTGVNNNITVVPGVSTTTYTLNIKSLSEVNVKYSIILGNIPSGIEVSLNGEDFYPPSSGTITFSNAGTILYSSQNKTNTHTLTFRGNNGATAVNNQTITVNVIAEQST